MPKIKVNERDLSWYYRQRQPGQLTILTPGVSTFGPYEPVIVNQDNFYKVLGNKSVDPADISYDMAASFVKSGADVLFWRQPLANAKAAKADAAQVTSGEFSGVEIRAKYDGSFGNGLKVKNVGDFPSYRVFVYSSSGTLLENFNINLEDPSSEYYYEVVNETSSYIEFVKVTEEESKTYSYKLKSEVTLEGGSDGTYSASAVAESISKDANKVFEDLADPYFYDFTVAVSGGYNNYVYGDGGGNVTKISTVDDKFIHLAETRGNTIYLVDGDRKMTSSQFFTYTDLPSKGNSEGLLSSNGFNTSYAAAFGPWSSARLISSGAIRELPGSYAFLIGWCQSLANGNPLWLAPAGVKRASLNFVTSTAYPVGAAVLEMWQNQEDIESNGHKINPIMNLKQYGYVVYGNSTLLKNREDGATSMLQSLSTRILSNMIKTRAFEISLSLQFDQIDDDLFAEFKTLMTTFMDQLKYDGALYDYKIVADRSQMSLEDLSNKTVPVQIMISPNPAAENFVVNLEISQAGVTFGDDATNNTTEG